MIDLTCPFCDFNGKNLTSLSTHAAMKHDCNGENLYKIKFSQELICSCGCGEKTEFISIHKGYRKTKKGHLDPEMLIKRGKNISKAFHDNPKTISEETRKKISESRKQGFKSGRIKNWSDKSINPDSIIWSKGKTKKDDIRIAEFGKKCSISLKQKFANGELKVWCDGKTLETDDRLKKISLKLKEKYKKGEFNSWQNSDKKFEISKKISEKHKLNNDTLLSRFEKRKNEFSIISNISDYKNNAQQLTYKCIVCNNMQNMSFQSFERGRLCDYCYGGKISKAQKEIFDFVKLKFNGDVLLNNRSVISPYEIDIYVPDKNFGIEYNGIYYHSSAKNPDNFEPKKHSIKQKLAQSSNIKLLQIFEDEWFNKREIIESLILHRLNLSENKIGARECELKIIEDKNIINDFFNKNHIDGSVKNWNINFSLIKNNEIISSLILRKPQSKKYKNYFEVARFATKLNTSVPGGLSKLIHNAKKWCFEQNNCEAILTYLDQRLGAINTYEKVGFLKVDETAPSFWWVSLNKMKRYNRQTFKATKDKTEKEIALENKVHKIYGCNNSIFIIKNDEILDS